MPGPVANPRHHVNRTMAENDDDILQECTRIRTEPDAQVVEVCVVRQTGTCSPDVTWLEGVRLPVDASEGQLAAARRKLLSRREFFAICKECRNRTAVGHLWMKSICRSCAARNHDVLF